MKELITSFAGGEVSPILAGRTDIPGMKRSCRILRNFLPSVTGGAFRLPSTFHVALAGSGGSRLLPFVAASVAAFQLELSAGLLKVYALDGTLEASIVAPWDISQIHAVQFTESNDVMWLVHPGVPVQELQRTPAGWTLNAMPWQWPPFATENLTATTVTPSATTGTITLTASASIWQAGHVGAYWQISHFRDAGSVEIEIPIVVDALATLTLTATPTAGEQITIGPAGPDQRIYTWVAVGSALSAYQVEIGTDSESAAANLIAAINAEGSSGFGPGTSRHPLVSAESGGTFAAGAKASGVLTCTGNDLTAGTPDKVIIDSVTYTFKDTLAAAFDVKRGADIAESLTNLQKAINLSGTAGTHYGVGTTIHPSVTAAAPVGGTLTITAASGGAAGNSIATTVADTSRLSWASVTLTGGATATTARVLAKSRKPGAVGNGIPVDAVMSAGAWNASKVTEGSSDLAATSSELALKGAWSFSTLGRWQGSVYIERRNEAGAWDVLRQFTGKLDTNRTADGIADEINVLRIRVAGMSGKESSDVPNPRFVLEAAESLVHGLVQITGYTSGTSVTATVVSGLQSTAATPFWREGAFSGVRGYPAAVALHEERLLFAGTAAEPQKVWGSAAGDFRDFEETGLAAGAWQYRFTSQQSNPIRWMHSGRGLIVATSGGERTWNSGEQGITPINPPLQQQLTFNGSEPIQAIGAGSAALFVQAGGLSLLEYGYEEASGSYIAPDLTQLIDHLTASGFKSVAFQRFPSPIIWACTNSGKLLSCTYARRDEVVGWARHDIGGTVESVSVCPGSTGQSDEVWFIVNRNGSRRIERLDSGHWNRLRDSGTLYHLYAAASGAPVDGWVSGLDHLEGQTVHVMANGEELPQRSVSGGRIFVGLRTSVIAGLAARCELQPELFDFLTQEGTSIGKRVVCKRAWIRFYQTRECDYAENIGRAAYAVPFRESSEPVDAPPGLFSGLRPVMVNGSYGDGVNLILSADGIQPINILSFVPDFELYG